MRVSIVSQAAAQVDGQAPSLSAPERAQLYQQVFGPPAGASDSVKPNREFEDLWLRFVASAAQFARQGAPGAPALSSESVGAAARALAAQAGPLVVSALAARDRWQVIDQAGAAELGGARNAARYRTMAEAGGAILEWVARHADDADDAAGTDADLLQAVDQWLAATGVQDDKANTYAQPEETAKRVTLWSKSLHAAVGLDGADDARATGRAPNPAALFSGPSGTGKTLAAHWLAASLGRDVMRIDLGRVVSEYIGETEKNLGAVFREAERSGAVLVLDEADALFGKRTGVQDAHDRYANIEVNYLLQRLESHAGVTILTAHEPDAIDPELLRKLKVVAFPLPPR
jgi:hypothetical protein